MCSYSVLEAGDADGEELEEAAELRGGHVNQPALDQALISVLHDPQETHQQIAARLCRQRVADFTRLWDKDTGAVSEHPNQEYN